MEGIKGLFNPTTIFKDAEDNTIFLQTCCLEMDYDQMMAIYKSIQNAYPERRVVFLPSDIHITGV